MRWIFFSIAALVAWGMWGLMAKSTLLDVDWRILATLSVPGYLIPLVAVFRGPDIVELRKPATYRALSIGLLAHVALVTFYMALETGDASTVVPILALYPALTLIAAVVILKESLTRYQLLGIALALTAGVLLARG